MIDNKVQKGKTIIDWFLNKKQLNQVVILLLIITGFFGWQYADAQKDLKQKVIVLEKTVKYQDSIIKKQSEDILILKYRIVSTEDYDRDDPNPRWITDAQTHIILWINPAYEKIYLLPKGFTSSDLLGTTGIDVFGDKVQDFINNNNQVKRKGSAMSFNNEFFKTTKHPIKRGGKIYAIAGAESRDFN